MWTSVAANWDSVSLDPDVLAESARLTCQREIFKFAAEQKRLDTRNDHFCPALRACRRRWFWWRVPAGHVIAFHPEFFGGSSVDGGGVVERGPRSGKRRSLVAPFSLMVRALRGTRHPLELRRAAVRLIGNSGARRGRRRDAAAVRPTGPVAHS